MLKYLLPSLKLDALSACHLAAPKTVAENWDSKAPSA